MHPAIRRRKVRVFIAEDSPKVVERLTDLLEQVGELEVIGHAADVREAAECIQRLRPDVVILDLRMTNGNGIDVLKTIKITRPETKVIIFSNLSDAQYRKRLLDTGADAFLDKSSDFNQIPGIVLKLVETRS